MPHTRTNWMNYSPPAINAANLLNMEDGIWYGLAHSGGVRNTAEFLDRNPASTTGGLAEAIADLAGGAGVVFAAPHNHPININYAIPANVHLIVSRGATLTIANGVTLTINGTFAGDLSQHFNCVGTGAVVFGGAAAPTAYGQWWGAVAGGVIDDTIPLQAAVDSLPVAGKGIVDGLNLLYLVTSINQRSNMVFENFRFKTKAGNTDLVSPVTIGANNDTTLRENITIRNVHVDGNRANQTGIGGAEDGGRHGFRIIGYVNNLHFENCSATLCASDGIEFYSGLFTRPGTLANNDPLQTNIFVKDSQFTWNRRGGGSGDSIEHARFDNVIFNYNGRTIGAAEGELGAGSPALFGTGFTMEGYNIGSYVADIVFDGCQGLQNARQGILFYDPTAPNTADFLARNNIRLSKCHLDSGTYDPNNIYPLALTCQIGEESLGISYQDIYISDCHLEGGLGLTLRAVDSVTINGGEIETPLSGWCGNLDFATNVFVGQTILNNKVFFETASTVTYLFPPLPLEDWHEVGAGGEPVFNNNWVNFGAPYETAAFFKDSFNIVHIKGVVKDGTGIPTLIFLLPAGYRPGLRQTFAVVSAGGIFGQVDVKADGEVRAEVGGVAFHGLNGITFRAV